MKVLIHDITDSEFLELYPEVNDDIRIFSKEKAIKKCIGCFGCWIKTPGKCIIKDSYENLGKVYANSEELIIISKIYYGGFSPYVKNVLDRSIGYLLPYFTIKNNEMHHKSRYKETLKVSVFAYGEGISENEKDTLASIIIANGINFNAVSTSLTCLDHVQEITKIRGSL